MCGFACVIGDGAGIADMLRILRHRGPDDEGVRRSEGAVLGFRRLSIVDLAGGAQPMSNEDGTLWLVCNGEIYNDPDLRRELRALGHTFRTGSDVETILHAYEQWGEECVHRLRGMFAFVLWDERTRTAFAARDRLGKKPLFFHHDGRRLLLASEMKAILCDPTVPRRILPAAIRFYLRFHYIPAPYTIFRDIAKLEPGHCLRWREGKLETWRYWTPDLSTRRQSVDAWADELRGTLEEAVRLRLRSDVPFGAYLSGGIDSTIVVGLMSRILREPVRTFSIGFDDPNYSELPYAKMAAEAFGTEHREFLVRPDAAKLLDLLVWHYDEPFGDSSALPTYLVAQVSVPFVKVILSGDGGDENFGGYVHHAIFRHVLGMRKVPAVLPRAVRPVIPPQWTWMSKALDLASMPPGQLYSRIVERFHSDQLDALLGTTEGKDVVDGYVQQRFEEMYRVNADPVRAAGYADLMTYLPSDILTKVDIASMANSQEVRCPLLDHKVVELALRMPGDLKLRGETSKYILKRAFRDLLPRPLVERRKQGFSIPARPWFTSELRPLAEEALLGSDSKLRDWLRMEDPRRLMEEHQSGKRDHSDRIWGLLFLERWLRRNTA